MEERLIIKNFGPIVETKIEIKPFMVFIGESGSGKSVVLKLLSLFRWICKKNHLKLFAKRLGAENLYRFRIERMVKESGLDDFFKNITYIEYDTELENIVVSQENERLQLKINPKTENIQLHLEKISFITDDRFVIPLLSNNKIRGILPYHLEKTFEDFNESFEHLQINRKVKMKIFDIELLLERYGIQSRFMVCFKDSKTQFHNASSGMKSVTIVELILSYFALKFDWKSKIRETLFDVFWGMKFENMERASNAIHERDVPFRLSFFIEEPELSLFPNAQKAFIEYLASLFNQTKNREVNIAFSTHSPYILSALNCLLEASAIFTKKPELKQEIEKILPKEYWLSIQNFNAYKVKDGKVISIIDKETNLILADEIDEVSEEIGEIFDKLLDLEYD